MARRRRDRSRSADNPSRCLYSAAHELLDLRSRDPQPGGGLGPIPDGVLHDHGELRRFFGEGARRRPNDLVRWYRTGEWLTDGRRMLVWEYPRETPDGDQVDLVEVMEIGNGLIRHHRIYWGWKGCGLIAPALSR